MRFVSPVFVLALAAMSFAQAPPQTSPPSLPEKMTYQSRAERVPKLLENWSADFKIKFDATPQFQNEVVLVSVKDQPTELVMKHVATVTGGKWEKTSTGGYRLIPNAEARAARDREVTAVKLKRIREQIAAALKPNPDDAEGAAAAAETAAAEMASSFFGGGTSTSIYKILADMDLTPVARMKPGDRLVYSSSPTRMQRPLPPSAGGYVAEYVKNRNAGLSGQPDMSDNAEMASMMAMMPPGYKERMARDRRPIKEFAKALLVIGSDKRMGSQDAELRLYDRTGAVVGSAQASIDPNFLSSMMEEAKEMVEPDKPPVAEKTTPVEYSADTKAFEATKPGFAENSRTQGKPLDPETKKRLLDVSNVDPLSLGATDEMLSYAKSLNKPIIASLSDGSGGFLSQYTSRLDATVESIQEDLKSGKNRELVKDDIFIIIRPADPEEARTNRTDRISLAKLLTSASPEGLVRLNDLAAFAAVNEDPRNGSVISSYLTLFAPGVNSGTFGTGADWEALKFYSRINPLVGQRLVKAEAVPLNAFDARPIDAMVFGHTPKLIVERGKPEARSGFMDMIYQSMSTMGGGGTDYKDEPTEILAGGFPAQSNVSVKVTEEPFLTVGPGESSEMGLGSMGLDEMAVMQYLMSNKDFMKAMGSNMPKMPKMKRGTRTVYEFTVRLGDGLSVRQTLTDQVLPKDPQFVEFNKYPADIQALLNSRIEEIKKSPMASIFGMMGTLGRGNQPPP